MSFLKAENFIFCMLNELYKFKKAKTRRISSWDTSGKNADWWPIEPGESRVIADIKGPGKITHIWMTTGNHYRELLIKITWDNAKKPSVLVPYGDFFCLGHGIVNSFQNFLFSASTAQNNKFNAGCALNCYAPMPFKDHVKIELINESKEIHRQYFYIDYELYESVSELGEDWGYFHAEFHRENPFGGWAHEIIVNTPEADIVNTERLAWDNNLVILETKGRGHYLGCNYSVTNFQGTWWGEGDDMIWIDGYKWPPELHGTGSEDYLNQAWGMQRNAFMRNGSSIFENDTWGYQTSYNLHLDNPVRFEKEIKVTIEFGHGNHLRNEASTVAYFYLDKPTAVKDPPSVEKRMPVFKKNGEWDYNSKNQITSREVPLNDEMKQMKRRWKGKNFPGYFKVNGIFGKDDDGEYCVKMRISRENPEIYDVTLSEIFENILNSPLQLEILDKIYCGTLKVDGKGKLKFIGKDSKELDLSKLFGDIEQKEIEAEVLQIVDKTDKNVDQSANLILTFK